jgi:fimbrial chaperone protein
LIDRRLRAVSDWSHGMPVRLCAGVLCFAAFLAATAATAGTFSIAPVRVELQGSARTAVLTVHNDDDAPLVIQASMLAWSQPGGEEQYTASHDLLVTPPVFTLPARGEQILRVALRTAPDATHELDYRLLLAEVPQAPAKGFTGLQLALRLSLPVFILPGAPAHPELHWRAQRRTDGTLLVTATNTGTAHLQVIDFDLVFGAAQQSAHASVTRYVLPGSSIAWTLTAPAGVAPDAALSVHGHGDQGEFQADVAASGP